MNYYQSNNYTKNQTRNISTMSQGFQRNIKCEQGAKSLAYPFLQLIQHIQLAIRSTTPDIKAVFHERSNFRFIAIKLYFSRKQLYRKKIKASFRGSNLSNRENVRAPIQCRREGQSQMLKDGILSRRNKFDELQQHHRHLSNQMKKLSFPCIAIKSHSLKNLLNHKQFYQTELSTVLQFNQMN